MDGFVFIPRPSVHRRKRESETSQVPVAVHVVSVEAISEHFAVWTFDADATWNGVGTIPQLIAETGAGLMSPAEVWQVSANQIAGNYDDGELVAGGVWRVESPPEHVEFGGATLVVPTGGEIE